MEFLPAGSAASHAWAKSFAKSTTAITVPINGRALAMAFTADGLGMSVTTSRATFAGVFGTLAGRGTTSAMSNSYLPLNSYALAPDAPDAE